MIDLGRDIVAEEWVRVTKKWDDQGKEVTRGFITDRDTTLDEVHVRNAEGVNFALRGRLFDFEPVEPEADTSPDEVL